MKKIFYFLSTLLIFSSCTFLETPVRNYFKEYTENASVARYTFEKDGRIFLTDNDGITSVSSEKDCHIYFDLINPQQYVLIPSFEFLSDDAKNSPYAKDVKIYQDENDVNIIHLYYPKDFLLDTECGKNIGFEIIMNEPKTQRVFSGYKLNLRSNSPPLLVDDTFVMVNNNKYYFCFNMPLLKDTVHQDDTHKIIIKIDEKAYEWDFNPEGINSTEMNFTGTTKIALNSPGELKPTTSTSGVFTPSERAFYLDTGLSLSDKEIVFEVQLIDDKGLKSSYKLSNRSTRLEKPIFDFEDNSTFNQENENGTKNVLISAVKKDVEGQILDGDVQITVIVNNDGKEIINITNDNIVELQLPPGKNEIKAFQSKELFVSSETIVRICNINLSKAYIDSKSINEFELGTKENPFKNIETPLEKISDKQNEKNLFILENDIELNKNIILENMNLTIKNEDENKIQFTTLNNMLKITEDSQLSLQNIDFNGNMEIDGNSMILLQNTKFAGNLQINSGNVTFKQNCSFAENTMISLNNKENHLIFDSKINCDKEILLKLTEYTPYSIIAKVEGDYKFTEEDAIMFICEDEEYQIYVDENNNLCVKEKPKASTEEIKDVEFEYEKEENLLKVTVSATDILDNKVDLRHLMTNLSMKIMEGNFVIAEKSVSNINEECVIDISTIKSDLFQLYMETTINGQVWSKQTIVKK